MYINIENTIFQDNQDVQDFNPKILLEEFKRLHAQSGIFGTIKRKTQKIKVTTDN